MGFGDVNIQHYRRALGAHAHGHVGSQMDITRIGISTLGSSIASPLSTSCRNAFVCLFHGVPMSHYDHTITKRPIAVDVN